MDKREPDNHTGDDARRVRETRGTCPVCFEIVPACVILKEGAVYLEKNCPEHGSHRVLLSNHGDYYLPLMEAYFDLLPESLPQRDYILRLTGRCNMDCPICLASANRYEEQDLPLEQIRDFLRGRRRLKLDLMGAEPTEREDLETIIREIKQGSHIAALHTNGLRIADPTYLERLVAAGLDEVHLQMDGFDEQADRVLRGRSTVKQKKQALAALERFDLATDLVVTLLKGVNEDQMAPVLDYAARHPFIKEVFFLGCRQLGGAAQGYEDRCLVPDEVIDLLEARTNGKVNREDLRVFQKLYFAVLSIFRVRKCFYIHHYLVLRHRDGYRPVSQDMDLPYLEVRLDRFRVLRKKRARRAVPYLLVHIVRSILRRRGYSLLFHGAGLGLMMLLGFNLKRLRRRLILLGFITACDPWIHDEQVALNCGKGEVATDVGVHEAGADANVKRERLHRK